jgi:4'-phosphopantetheinyl transferase
MRVEWQTNFDASLLSQFIQTDGLIHVWRIDLDVDSSVYSVLTQLLSIDEQARASRFRYDRDRDRFVVARASMRRLLSRYCNQSPSRLQFCYGSHGKPSLGASKLEFNLSHTEDLAVLAIAHDRPVGIDIERIHPMEDLEKIAGRFFVAGEHQRIMQVENADRPRVFFRTWTCKEAYLKATGAGLGKLKSLEVAINPEQAAYCINPQDWDLQEIVPAAGFVGAIAAPGIDWRTQFWQFAHD